jgi:hypothetical protein
MPAGEQFGKGDSSGGVPKKAPGGTRSGNGDARSGEGVGL